MRNHFYGLLLALLLPAWASAQCTAIFQDGFESGSYSPTWSVGSSITGAVTTNTPSSGMYRLEGTGGTTSHLNGFSTAIAPVTPTEFSWDVYPTGSAATNYMVAGDASITANNCMVFCYWVNGASLNFISSAVYSFPASPNQWYHIKLRNINWTSRTFDIWIDGILRYTGFPFRSSTINNLSRIHLYNFSSGNAAWDNIQVGEQAVPLTSTIPTAPACNGETSGAIDLSVTGGAPGYSYLWSNGATTQDLTGLSAGTYAVTVTDLASCSSIDSVTLTDPPALVTNLAGTPLSCNGSQDGAIDNSPSGGTPGYSYLWSNGATVQDISGLAAGAYQVTITDNNGCDLVDTITIAQPTAISINSTAMSTSCYGTLDGQAMVTPTGGAGGYSYIWSTGSTSNNSGAVGAGGYAVIVTDQTGCSVMDSAFVSEPDSLSLNGLIDNPLCANTNSGAVTAVVTGGTPVYSYAWSNGSTSALLSNVGAGTFGLTVTDQNGCTSNDSYVLTAPAAIVATGTTSDDTGTNNGAINLSLSGGTGPFSYSWSNGATTEDITGLAAGTYTVTITDANSCELIESFTVDLVIAITAPFPTQISIVPNPFQDAFEVQLGDLGNLTADLTLYDMQGRVLWSEMAVSANRVRVATALSAGVYFLEVSMANQRKTFKVARR